MSTTYLQNHIHQVCSKSRDWKKILRSNKTKEPKHDSQNQVSKNIIMTFLPPSLIETLWNNQCKPWFFQCYYDKVSVQNRWSLKIGTYWVDKIDSFYIYLKRSSSGSLTNNKNIDNLDSKFSEHDIFTESVQNRWSLKIGTTVHQFIKNVLYLTQYFNWLHFFFYRTWSLFKGNIMF
jgi:hypothetical protein